MTEAPTGRPRLESGSWFSSGSLVWQELDESQRSSYAATADRARKLVQEARSEAHALRMRVTYTTLAIGTVLPHVP